MKHKSSMDLVRMVVNMLIDYHTMKDHPKSDKIFDSCRNSGTNSGSLLFWSVCSSLTEDLSMKELQKILLLPIVMKYKRPILIWLVSAPHHHSNSTIKWCKQRLVQILWKIAIFQVAPRNVQSPSTGQKLKMGVTKDPKLS
jgi:hypothetical protein